MGASGLRAGEQALRGRSARLSKGTGSSLPEELIPNASCHPQQSRTDQSQGARLRNLHEAFGSVGSIAEVKSDVPVCTTTYVDGLLQRSVQRAGGIKADRHRCPKVHAVGWKSDRAHEQRPDIEENIGGDRTDHREPAGEEYVGSTAQGGSWCVSEDIEEVEGCRSTSGNEEPRSGGDETEDRKGVV